MSLRSHILFAIILLLPSACLAVGNVSGNITDYHNEGMYETEIFACRSGVTSNSAYYRCTTSGYYEMANLTASTYSLGMNDPFHVRPRLRSFVPIRDGQTTPGNIKLRSTYYVRGAYLHAGTPACTEIRQTFKATGDPVKVTFWMPTDVNLNVSFHNASTGVQVGPTRTSGVHDRSTAKWLNGEVPLTPGTLYYIKMTRSGGGTFALYCNTNQGGSLYPDGQAYYDGAAQPGVDIGMVIESDDDGLATMVQRSRNNDGVDGTEIGQTFKALGTGINIISFYGTSWEGSSGTDITFSIHQGGPGGAQIGLAKTMRLRDYRPMGQMACVTWQPGEVSGLVPGQTYYLKMTSTGFYIFISTENPYPNGNLYVDGVSYPTHDGLITIAGEKTLESSLCTITGTVRDAYGTPVVGATISTSNFGYSTTSGAGGVYTLKVTGDFYDITCSKSGYFSKSVSNYDAKAGTTKTLDFTISMPGRILGYVKDTGGNGIVGATVTASPGNYSVQSQTGGYYSIDNMEPATYSLTASRSGYLSQTKPGIVVTQGNYIQCDFALQPKLALDNPGFELGNSFDNPPQGWTKYGHGLYVRTGTGYGSITPHGGTRYATHEASWTDPKTGGLYQSLSAAVGAPVTVTVWATCYGEGGGAAHTFARVGVDPTGGTNPTSALIQWSAWYNAPSDNFWEWVQLSKTATPTSNIITVFLDYVQQPNGIYAYAWQINGFDDVEVAGPASTTLPVAKQAGNGSYVYFEPVVITAKFSGTPNFFFVEDPDRIAGIRVNGNTSFAVGDKVRVGGTINTAVGERYVTANAVDLIQAGYGDLVPLGMTNIALGGGTNGAVPGITGAYGTNNIGLLVTAWGRVAHIDATSFFLTDGSDVTLKVIVPSTSDMPANGSYAVVTGASSTYDAGGGSIGRLLRARSGGIISY